MFTLATAKKYIAYIVAIGLLIAGLVYWINWSMDQVAAVTKKDGEIKALNEKVDGLQEKYDELVERKTNTTIKFDEITDDQVTLLCAARYNQPLIKEDPATPVIKEVIVYRDRTTKCPTLDPTKAEDVPVGAVMRPVNDEIRVRTLNNSWKAYCIATGNKEDVCTPFR